MRLLARRHGAAYTLCEVMLDQFLVQVKERKRTSHFLHLSDEERPVGGQLMGAEPEQFAAGAQRLVAAGFDVIDINFGCPVKKVLGRCRGGFLLGQPDTALDIIRRTRDATPDAIPVTLKMRRGVDDSDESRERFFTILDGAFDAGLAAVTVHGRTVAQRYVGPSNWDFLAEVKRHAGDRVIFGSGDLFTPEDCLAMLQQTGVDGVTIARGAIGNPWIFGETRALWKGEQPPPPPSLHEQRAVMTEQFELVQQLYGEQRGPTLMRKFAVRYANLHPQYEQVRNAVARVKDRAHWRAIMDQWYGDDGPGRRPDVSVHRGQA